MRLTSVRIQNFRSFRDETISLDAYTCVVGPNGSGKSAILAALNVLFRNQSAPTDVVYLEEEDFHQKDVTQTIRITATFDQLSPSAKDDLKAYVRQDKLVISSIAKWDPDRHRAEVTQVGSRLVIRSFGPFFESFEKGSKVAELKEIYGSLRNQFSELPEIGTKDGMKDALRTFEESKPEFCELVESADQFYGWSKGTNRLDKHIQWVFIPAVKDPTEEQDESKETALGRLLQRTIRAKVDFASSIESLRGDLATKYQALLLKEQGVLSQVGDALQDRLREWAHPGARVELIWHYDEQKSVTVASPMARAKVGEGAFLGDLVRLGHGLQRSFLVAILQELSALGTESQPKLILGFEEPELYQHPPQARHLAALLESLSEKDSQVIITTHSPYFVSGRGFETIRRTCKDSKNGRSSVNQLNYSQLSSMLAEALGEAPRRPSSVMAVVEQIMQPSQSELYFSTLPILVEGLEDVAFISTHLRLTGRWSEFRRFGCHFVICGGKNPMSRPLAIALGLRIPVFVVADGDADKCESDGGRQQQERDNSCLLRLCGHSDPPIPDATYWRSNLVLWRRRILDEIRDEFGDQSWAAAEAEAREKHGLQDGVTQKNLLLISGALEILHAKRSHSELLNRLCDSVFSLARSTTTT
jgi:predicted ATPase